MLADGICKNGTVMLFGDGRSVGNYIAGEDVAALSLQILLRDDVVNETIEIGGPSNVSLDEMATLVGRHRPDGEHDEQKRRPVRPASKGARPKRIFMMICCAEFRCRRTISPPPRGARLRQRCRAAFSSARFPCGRLA